MKLRFILSAFAALLLASCSSDDSIPVPAPVPETIDTNLSIATSNGKILTKADEPLNPEKATNKINTVTVAIFRGEPSTQANADSNGETSATVTSQKGSLLYLHKFDVVEKASESSNGEIKAEAVRDINGNVQINGIKLKAGNIDMLIMANLPETPNVSKKSDLETWSYGDLKVEGLNNKENQYCSMSSKWISVSLTPGADDPDNQIWYVYNNKGSYNATTENPFRSAGGELTTENLIPLTRNVSAICFSNIKFSPAASWGGVEGATLTLKQMFVTNAIEKTSVLPSTTMKPDWKFYCGNDNSTDREDVNTVLKKVENEFDDIFQYEFTGPNLEMKKGDNYNKNTKLSAIDNKYFMVYENSTETKFSDSLNDGKQTLITLLADYSYVDANGQTHDIKDCYYTVIVNDPDGSFKGDTGIKKLIERNYIYYINLEVQGPGSKKPYEPLYSANATAFVEAAPWTGAIDINQDAE